MELFIWVILGISYLSTAVGLVYLGNGEVPIITPKTIGIRIILRLSIIIWAVVLLAGRDYG